MIAILNSAIKELRSERHLWMNTSCLWMLKVSAQKMKPNPFCGLYDFRYPMYFGIQFFVWSKNLGGSSVANTVIRNRCSPPPAHEKSALLPASMK